VALRSPTTRPAILAGPPYLAEGEMAVLEPKGSTFVVVARVRLDDWQAFK
jgi:hypothetical protein